MVKLILIRKASHGQKCGNNMSNLVIDLSLHIRQNRTYNLHIKTVTFNLRYYIPPFLWTKIINIQILEKEPA